MTFALAPLGSIPSVDALSGALGTTSVAGTTGVAGAAGSGFGNMLTEAVENLEQVQQNADGLAVRAVTGDLEDVHEYTVAATEAKMTLELTAAVRNKAVEAFNEILRMQA